MVYLSQAQLTVQAEGTRGLSMSMVNMGKEGKDWREYAV